MAKKKLAEFKSDGVSFLPECTYIKFVLAEMEVTMDSPNAVFQFLLISIF